MLRAIKAAPRVLQLSLMLLGAATALTIARVSQASDHQDTAEVEIKQLPDINDVYAFPGSTSDRLALALTTASPVTPAQSQTIGFDDQAMYQIKVDNTGDAVEDLVFQVLFDGKGPTQRVRLYGPAKPNMVGRTNTRLGGAPTLIGATNTMLGSANGVQFQAGLFDDPFYIDLEQFFRIIPDRKPERGPLSLITKSANAFRNPGIDFLRGFNALGIVIELPEDMLLPQGAGPDPKIGIWATTSY